MGQKTHSSIDLLDKVLNALLVAKDGQEGLYKVPKNQIFNTHNTHAFLSFF